MQPMFTGDSDVNLGERYCYKLEDIDDTGCGALTMVRYRRRSAPSGPLSPKNGRRVRDRHDPVLPLEGRALRPFQTPVLQAGRFSVRRRLNTRHRGRGSVKTSFTPGKDKWKGVAGLTGSGRAVYWRVTGKDSAGGMYTSNAFRLFVSTMRPPCP